MFPVESKQPLLESPVFSCLTENGKKSPLYPIIVLLTPSGRSQVRFMTFAIGDDSFLGVPTAFLASAANGQQFAK